MAIIRTAHRAEPGPKGPDLPPLGPGSPLRYGRGDEEMWVRQAITTTTTRRFWARASGVFKGLAGVVSP